MKPFLLLLLLSAPSFASDNCYIFERGSDSWLTCKEQAQQNAHWWDQHKSDDRQLEQENAQALTQDTLLQALLNKPSEEDK